MTLPLWLHGGNVTADNDTSLDLHGEMSRAGKDTTLNTPRDECHELELTLPLGFQRVKLLTEHEKIPEAA